MLYFSVSFHRGNFYLSASQFQVVASQPIVSKVEVIARNPLNDSLKKTRGTFELNFIKIRAEISEKPSGNFNVSGSVWIKSAWLDGGLKLRRGQIKVTTMKRERKVEQKQNFYLVVGGVTPQLDALQEASWN